jgi:hypothetical protein
MNCKESSGIHDQQRRHAQKPKPSEQGGRQLFSYPILNISTALAHKKSYKKREWKPPSKSKWNDQPQVHRFNPGGHEGTQQHHEDIRIPRCHERQRLKALHTLPTHIITHEPAESREKKEAG